MRKFKRVIILAVFFSIMSYAGSASAGGGGMTGGATLAQQIINKGELVNQVNELVTQTKQQLQMYANMVTNTLGLDMAEWIQAMNTIKQMRNLYDSAGGLAYGIYGDMTGYVQNWENLFPAGTQKQKETIAEIRDREAKICEDIVGITGKAAQQAGVTKQDLADDAKLTQTLMEKGQSVQGQMQALQTAIQVAGQTNMQLIKLRGEYQNSQLVIQKAIGANAQQNEDFEAEGKKGMGTEPEVKDFKIKKPAGY